MTNALNRQEISDSNAGNDHQPAAAVDDRHDHWEKIKHIDRGKRSVNQRQNKTDPDSCQRDKRIARLRRQRRHLKPIRHSTIAAPLHSSGNRRYFIT